MYCLKKLSRVLNISLSSLAKNNNNNKKTAQLHPLALIILPFILLIAEVSKITNVNTHSWGKHTRTDYICCASNHNAAHHKSAPDKLPQQAESCQLSCAKSKHM